MSPAEVFFLITACLVASFFGAMWGVKGAEKFYSRKQDNKLYGTVFATDATVEPVGDTLLTPEEYEMTYGQSSEECDSPEPHDSPPTSTGTGWVDNHAAGSWPPSRGAARESKPLPGDLGK